MDQVKSIIESVFTFINVIAIPMIFTITFLVFIWGIYNFFIAGATAPDKREEGKQYALWGIIGFFVMFSVWGLVNILVGTFGFDQERAPNLPLFGGSSATQEETTIFGGSNNCQPSAPGAPIPEECWNTNP